MKHSMNRFYVGIHIKNRGHALHETWGNQTHNKGRLKFVATNFVYPSGESPLSFLLGLEFVATNFFLQRY